MKVLLASGMTRALNPNPYIVDCVERAFREELGDDRVAVATAWDLDDLASVWKPDLILGFSSRIIEWQGVPFASLRARRDIPFGWWLTDDPYEIDHSVEFASYFDFVFTNDRSCLSAYDRTRALHLPLGADPALHFRPVLTDDDAYEWDVYFCGVAYPNRRTAIEAVSEFISGLKTQIRGPWWPEASFTAEDRIAPSSLSDVHNRSRIVLNLPRYYDLFNEKTRALSSTPAPRTFETAAAGGFQLMFADRPEIADYFDVPQEIDTFATAEQFIRKVTYYLERPDVRIAAAHAAQRRCLEEHTYRHRVRQLIEQVRSLDLVAAS